MAPLSLLQLLDDAIGKPEENVRFSALHRLLRAILGHLNLQDLPVLEAEQGPTPLLREHQPGQGVGQGGETGTEPKPLGPGKEPRQGPAGRKREEPGSGVSKAVAVSPDLLDEVAGIKAAQSRMAEDIQKMREALGLLQGNVPDAASHLPGPRDLAALDSAVKRLEERLSLLPAPEELCDVVRWGELEDCLVPSKAGGGGRALQRQAEPGIPTITPGMQPETSSTQTTTSGMQPTHPVFPEEAAGQKPHCPGAVEVPAEATPGAVATDRDVTSTQLPQAGHPAAGTLWVTPQGFEIPLCNTDASTASPTQEPPMPWGSSGSSSATSPYTETEEALRQIGQLGHLYTALKEQVAQQEATKVDHQELEKLRQFLPEGDEESITNVLADLRGQMSSLQAQMSSLQSQMSSLQSLTSEMQVEKEKIRQMEDAMGKLRVTGQDRREDGRHQTTEQLGATLQKIKRQLKELGEQQDTTKATLEKVQSQMAKQEQLAKLQPMEESTGQEPAEEQAVCHICSTDMGAQVGQLLRRYEKLQEVVDSFMSQQAVSKVMRQLPGRSQEEGELLKHLQATLTQVQGDYKELSSVTGNLLGDLRQKDTDIEALFQSLARLEKDKVDKEELSLAIDVKADKSALAGKVSHPQFDACMERLTETMQETLSQVTGLEQDWLQVQRQLSQELDTKVDRLELGPFQQQLEERWKNIQEQLQKLLTPEAEDAAGIKKQLLQDFKCLSCDRSLSVLVPGPTIMPLPSIPPLSPCQTGNLNAFQKQSQQHREQEAKCRYSRVPRQCGGQHTLTQPLQRCLRLQAIPPSTPRPRQHVAPELLGQHGRVSRLWTDGQLPVLVGEEGFLGDKPELSPRPMNPWDSSRLLSRPQSARPALIQMGTVASMDPRPASSNSHLSHASELLRTQQDGPRTPQDRMSPVTPPSAQRLSRRAGSSSQQ